MGTDVSAANRVIRYDHTVQTYQTVDERLDLYGPIADFAVANDQAALDLVTYRNLIADPWEQRLEIHPAVRYVAAHDLHVLDLLQDRKDHIEDGIVIDPTVTI